MHRCIFNNGNIRRKTGWQMYNSLIMTTSEGIQGILISKLPGQLGTAGTGVEECRGSVGEPFSWHQVVGLQEKWACYQTHCYQETVKTPGIVNPMTSIAFETKPHYYHCHWKKASPLKCSVSTTEKPWLVSGRLVRLSSVMYVINPPPAFFTSLACRPFPEFPHLWSKSTISIH